MGWIVIHGRRNDDDDDDASVVVTPLPTVDNFLSNKYQLLPPSIEIKRTIFSLRNPWARPIISVQVSGITINIIVRRTITTSRCRGEFFPPRSMNNKRVIDEQGCSSTFSIGDMTIREALMMLPRPPDVEGLYPRIGIVNITNVTLCVYESCSSSSVDDVDDISSSGRSLSLKLLLKFSVPDSLFVPVTNMTLGERLLIIIIYVASLSKSDFVLTLLFPYSLFPHTSSRTGWR